MSEGVFKGCFVHTPRLGCLEIMNDHVLSVDHLGYISYIGPASSPDAQLILHAAADRVQCLPAGSFLLPTFVDLHLHAPQFLYLGTGLHLPLMQWLEKYAFKAEEDIDNNSQLARKVYTRLVNQLIENGTGAALMFGTLKEDSNLILAQIFQARRLRGFVGKLSMDASSRRSYVEHSARDSADAAESFVTRLSGLLAGLEEHERFVYPVITPRFIPTCSNELLRALGKVAHNHIALCQSHMSESLDQVTLVRNDRGLDDIEIFEEAGLLGDRSVFAHCTYLLSEDFDRIRASGSSIAHCPLSNVYFSDQPFPLREALERELKVGLGSDVAGGYSLDMMLAMRTAVAVSRMRNSAAVRNGTQEPVNLSIDWKESLYLATAGGAGVLSSVSNRLSGTLAVGAPFDAQLIAIASNEEPSGIGSICLFQPHDWTNIDEVLVEKWWSLGDCRNRRFMWMQGQLVLKRDSTLT